MIKLKEGMVLNLNTCDAVDPITLHETNPHIEKELVVGVKNDYIKLYRLNYGNYHKVETKMMDIYIKMGLYTITDEKA